MSEKTKKTPAKTVKKSEEKSQTVKNYESVIDEIKARLEKNPMLKLGGLMSNLQYGDCVYVLYYITELEKKYTPEELEKIAEKVMKKNVRK